MTDMNADQLFERCALKTLTSSSEYFSKVFAILKEDYFTDSRREVFRLIKNHYLQHKVPPNLQDVAIQIKNLQSQEHKKAIVEEIRAIQDSQVPNSMEAICDETLKFVKDALYLQALEVGSEGLMLKSDELKAKAEEILAERAKVNIASDLGIEFQDEQKMMEYYSTLTNGILTQHQSLNDRLGPGFLPGTLSLFAAPSGVGKSLIKTDLISSWVTKGKNVLLVSLEMSSEEVIKRVHSNTLNIPVADLNPKNFDRDGFHRKMKEARSKGLGIFYAKDYPALTFSALQLDSLLDAYKNEKNVEFDVVLVDYLGIMKSDLLSPSAGLYSYVKSIAEELRSVAKRRDVAILSSSQLNRAATNNLQSDNATISDSMGTLMTADFLMFLLQTEEMKETGDMVWKITKNRFSGRTESFPMKVDYTYMRFLDPDIPVSAEDQTKFMEDFQRNSAACDEELREAQMVEVEIAKRLDEKMRNSEPEEDTSLNSLLEDLM